ncbi:hypothetical protein [Streptomyces sp. NPDC047453]|uniref:hypothetical protein n=1 Tax=Streptomyces sp. NPDC047453 TaxID=3154812 RepID=UPI0033CED7B6
MTYRGADVSAEETNTRGRSAGWTAGRIAAVVVGGILSLVALTLVGVGGTAMAMAFQDDGYIDLGTDRYAHRTDTYAMATDGWNPDKAMGGLQESLRITYTPDNAADPVFIGLADEAGLRQYLDGVQHTTIHDSGAKGDTQTEQPGGAPKTLPDQADMWLAKASGKGAQTLKWTVQPGDVAAVAMKADGSSGLAGHVTVAAKFAYLSWIGVAFLVAGLVLLVGSVVLLIMRPVRHARRRTV